MLIIEPRANSRYSCTIAGRAFELEKVEDVYRAVSSELPAPNEILAALLPDHPQLSGTTMVTKGIELEADDELRVTGSTLRVHIDGWSGSLLTALDREVALDGFLPPVRNAVTEARATDGTLGCRLSSGERTLWLDAPGQLDMLDGTDVLDGTVELGITMFGKSPSTAVGFTGSGGKALSPSELLARLGAPAPLSLPTAKLVLHQLRFDPATGVMVGVDVVNGYAPGGAMPEPYELRGILGLGWSADGLSSFEASVEATERPPTVLALAQDLGLSEMVSGILPRPLADAELHRLEGSVELDDGQVLLGGAGKLLGVTASIDVALQLEEPRSLRVDLELSYEAPTLATLLASLGVIDASHAVWEYLPLAKNVGVGLRRLSVELEPDEKALGFAIGTRIGTSESWADLDVGVELGQGGQSFSLSYESPSSESSRSITLGDALAAALPAGAADAVTALTSSGQGQSKLLATLLATSLQALEIEVELDAGGGWPRVAFASSFTLLGQPFDVTVRVDPVEGQAPSVWIRLRSEEGTGLSIADLCEGLGISLGVDRARLPAAKLGLHELAVDTAQQSFRVAGIVTNGFSPSEGLRAYSLIAYLSLERTDEGMRIAADLDADEQPVTLRALAKDLRLDDLVAFMPAGFDVELSQASIELQTAPKRLGLALSVALTFDDVLTLTGLTPTGRKAPRLALDHLAATVAEDGSLQLEAEIECTAKLSEIIGALLGVDYPEVLPDAQLVSLHLTLDTTTRAFELAGKGEVSWAIGGQSIEVTTSLELSRDASGKLACKVDVDSKLALEITDDLSLRKLAFACRYDGGTKGDGKEGEKGAVWSASGVMAGTVLGDEVSASIRYDGDARSGKLVLECTRATERPLLDIAGVATLDFSKLSLMIERKTEEGQSEASNGFALEATAGLALVDVLTVAGTLSIFHDTKGNAGLRFLPKDAVLELPGGTDPAWVRIGLGGLSIQRKGERWSFEASATLGSPAVHRRLPPWLRERLPEEYTGTLVIDSDGVSLQVARLTNPLTIELPALDAGSGLSLPLGTLGLHATDLTLRLGKRIEAKATLSLGIPSGLDFVFGVDRSTSPPTPSTRIFAKELDLSFEASPEGVSLTPLTSPLEAIELRKDPKDGSSWWDLDLGEAGAFTLKVPKLVYEAKSTSFNVEGELATLRELAIPMSPLKWVLTKLDLEALADALPADRIPLRSLSLLEDGKLRTEALLALLETVLGKELAQALRAPIERLDGGFSRLPERFREYLDFEIPKSFAFKLSQGADSSFRLDVRVREGDPPLRLLFPMMRGPLLCLQGVELHHLAVGTLLGGNLWLVQAKLYIDDFDIVTLVGSQVVPQGEGVPLPDTARLRHRVIIDDLLMLIIPQTGVPLPVPIFYRELGFDYLGLEGTEIRLGLGFPMPELDLAKLVQTAGNLKTFLSDRDYRLPEERPLGDTTLRLEIGQNYLQLPEYLGGKPIGFRGTKVIDGSELAAKLLNTLKFLRIDDIVGLVPREHRKGETDVTLGPLSSTSKWVVCTASELAEPAAVDELGLTPKERSTFLASLPRDIGQGEDGALIYLGGTARLGSLIELDMGYGLAVSSSMGMQTGLRFSGTVAKLIDIEVSGRIAVAAPQPAALGVGERAPSAPCFDGKSDGQEIPGHEDYAVDAVTIELWVRPDPDQKGIAFLVSHHHELLEIQLSEGSEGSADRRHIRFIPTKGVFIDTKSPPLAPGEWTHLACVYQPNAHARIHVDGTAVETRIEVDGKQLDAGTRPAVAFARSPGALAVGCRRADETYPFRGAMAELRLWNRCLDAGEIASRMRQRLVGDEEHLLGCWPLDDGFGDIGRDLSKRENHARLPKARWRSGFGPGLPLSADLLPASSADVGRFSSRAARLAGNEPVLAIAHHADYVFEAVTIELWVRSERAGFFEPEFLIARSHLDLEIHLGPKDVPQGIRFIPAKDLFIDTEAFAFVPGQWFHLACVYQPGVCALIYVDGRQVATKVKQGDLSTPLSSSTLGFVIGNRRGESFRFQGGLAELRLWNKVVPAEEIAQRMHCRVTGDIHGLLGCWPLDDGLGSRGRDTTKRRNSANLPGAAFRVKRAPDLPISPDRVCAPELAGSSCRATIPHHAAHHPDVVTIELWFRSTGAGNGVQFLLSQHLEQIEIQLNGGNATDKGMIRFIPAEKVYVDTPKGTVVPGQWTHLCCVYDPRIGLARISVNGRLTEVKVSGTRTTPIGRMDHALHLGRRYDDTFAFEGQLAEVRLWSRARSLAEVRAEMRLSMSGREPGLIGYWPLDEGTGTVIRDLAKAAQHGRLEDVTWSSRASGVEPSGAELAVVTETAFELLAQAHLTLAGHRIFHGSVDATERGFELDGVLQLFPPNDLLRIGGHVFGRLDEQGLVLAGRAEAAIGALVLSESHLMIVYQAERQLRGIWLRSRWLGRGIDFKLQEAKGHIVGTLEADLSPVARVTGKLDYDTDSQTGKLDVDVALGGFGTLEIRGAKRGEHGQLTIDMHGHRIFSGTGRPEVVEGVERLQIEGMLRLLPEGAAFDATGSLTGWFAAGSFDMAGQVALRTNLGGVLGASRAHICQVSQPDGSHETVLTLDMTFLDIARAEVRVVDDGKNFKMALGGSLGLLGLEVSATFAKDGRTGNAYFRTRGPLELSGWLELQEGLTADCSIKLFGVSLGRSNARLRPSGNEFLLEDAGIYLHGQLGVLNATIEASRCRGRIRSDSFTLNAAGRLSIQAGNDQLGLGVDGPFSAWINGSDFTADSLYTGFIMFLGTRYDVLTLRVMCSYRMWKGKRCFLAAWRFRTTGNDMHRLAIFLDELGSSFYNPFWGTWGDDDWPMDLRPPQGYAGRSYGGSIIPTGGALSFLDAASDEAPPLFEGPIDEVPRSPQAPLDEAALAELGLVPAESVEAMSLPELFSTMAALAGDHPPTLDPIARTRYMLALAEHQVGFSLHADEGSHVHAHPQGLARGETLVLHAGKGVDSPTGAVVLIERSPDLDGEAGFAFAPPEAIPFDPADPKRALDELMAGRMASRD